MNLYLASSAGTQHFEVLKKYNVDNVLISYAIYQKPETYLRVTGGWFPKRLMIDSGAFSVWSKGDRIDIDEYIKFCQRIKELAPPETEVQVVNLDVLPGRFGWRPTLRQREQSVKQGWENMLYMESKGFKVIHVFHQHEDFEILDKMREHLDYIGVSPANDVSMKEKLEWLNKVFFKLRDTIKTHGFAVTSEKQLYQYPFYSCDSSSWVAGASYGTIPVLKEDGTIKFLKYKNRQQVLELIKELPNSSDFMTDDYSLRLEIGTQTYQKLEKLTTDLWRKRGVNWTKGKQIPTPG
jgi:hypothetical protein